VILEEYPREEPLLKPHEPNWANSDEQSLQWKGDYRLERVWILGASHYGSTKDSGEVVGAYLRGNKFRFFETIKRFLTSAKQDSRRSGTSAADRWQRVWFSNYSQHKAKEKFKHLNKDERERALRSLLWHLENSTPKVCLVFSHQVFGDLKNRLSRLCTESEKRFSLSGRGFTFKARHGPVLVVGLHHAYVGFSYVKQTLLLDDVLKDLRSGPSPTSAQMPVS